MTIQQIVAKRVQADLERYFAEAKEHEDDEVQANTSIEERVKDFYLYASIGLRDSDRN